MAKDNLQPAFPFTKTHDWQEHNDGMSLRDYFAAKALSGLLCGNDDPIVVRCAQLAYEVADAMLKAREQADG